ncbi:MAG: ABC transporter substrate-binding protein [Solirubrobacterales bacterium]
MRKLILIGTLGTLLALLVSACGGGSSGGTISVAEEGATTTSAACEKEPVSGGTLTYARQLEVISLNPREAKNGNGDIFADEMLYSPLVRNDPNGAAKVVPALAEKWDVSSDGLTYTFHLRPNLKLSDGSPLTAEEIAWNLEQFADPEVNVSLPSLAEGIKSIKATDKSTVVIKLEYPVAAFLYNIAVFPAFVVSKEGLEKEGAAFWKHPVGTGPFVVKEFVNGSHITFERNPYYFEKGKPYLQSMRWNFVTNSNTRVLDLKSGEAQIADGIPFSQVESLQGDSGVEIQQVELPQEVLLVTNTKTPALADPHVRRAMSLAIDREEIDSAVFRGVGTVPNSVIQNFELDASDQEVPPFEYNVEKAKEELAKSKYAKGFSVSLQYPAGSDYFKQMALLLEQELGAIGIEVKLSELEASTIVERWANGEFEMTFPFVGTSSDIPVPDEYASLYALPEAELDGFKSFWTDKEIEGLVKKFITNTDESTRKSEWKTIQEKLNEEMPSLNVMDFPLVNGHQSTVCGTKANGLGVDQLQETWIAGNS